MPVEPTFRPDEALLRDLEAFGRTLQARTDGDITSPGIPELEILPTVDSMDSANGDGRGRAVVVVNRFRWVVAAAVAIVLVAAAVVARIDDNGSDMDPAVDEPTPTAPDQTEGVRTDTDDGENADRFLAVGPSTILAADGSPLGSISIDPATGEPILTVVDDDNEHTPYVQMAVAELLDDRELLTELGWRSDLIDERTAQAMTATRWLAQSGLTITTHLDPALSELAAQAIADNLRPGDDVDVSVITVDPATGGVVVFETTSDTVYWTSTLSDSNPSGTTSTSDPLDDDAFLCCRVEPGSAFKTIVLAAALDDGASPDDVVRADGPCVFETAPGSIYRVGGVDRPEQSLAAATRSSNNCAYVRLGLNIGTETTSAMAERLGLTELPTEDDGPLASLPLGTWPVDPVEFTGAYATIAHDGRLVQPHFVAKIADTDGDAVDLDARIDSEGGQQVLRPDTARRVTDVLTSVVEDGTGTNARLDGRQVAGKTGTMNDFTSAWFVGYTTTWTTTVWLGHYDAMVGIESRRPILLEGYGTVFGGELPAIIWQDFMEPAHADIEPGSFPEAAPIDREPRLIEAAEDRTGEQ